MPKITHCYDVFLPDDSSSAHFNGGCGGASASADDRKKRPRTAFTAAQIKALESEFEKNKYLSVSKRMQLSKQLKLTETQVGIGYVPASTKRLRPGLVFLFLLLLPTPA